MLAEPATMTGMVVSSAQMVFEIQQGTAVDLYSKENDLESCSKVIGRVE